MEEVASRTIELDELRPQLRQAHAENQQLVSQLLTIKEGIAGKLMTTIDDDDDANDGGGRGRG